MIFCLRYKKFILYFSLDLKNRETQSKKSRFRSSETEIRIWNRSLNPENRIWNKIALQIFSNILAAKRIRLEKQLWSPRRENWYVYIT